VIAPRFANTFNRPTIVLVMAACAASGNGLAAGDSSRDLASGEGLTDVPHGFPDKAVGSPRLK
jgi:hypothetical protein